LVFFWQDGRRVADSDHFTNDFNGHSCTGHLRTAPKLLLDQQLAEIGTSRLKSAHRGIASKSQLKQHPDRTAHRGPLSCHRNLVFFRALRRCLARLKTEKPDPGPGPSRVRRLAAHRRRRRPLAALDRPASGLAKAPQASKARWRVIDICTIEWYIETNIGAME